MDSDENQERFYEDLAFGVLLREHVEQRAKKAIESDALGFRENRDYLRQVLSGNGSSEDIYVSISENNHEGMYSLAYTFIKRKLSRYNEKFLELIGNPVVKNPGEFDRPIDFEDVRELERIVADISTAEFILNQPGNVEFGEEGKLKRVMWKSPVEDCNELYPRSGAQIH